MRIENYRITRPRLIVLILTAVVLVAAFVAGTVHTVRGFKPAAESIMSEQAAMSKQLDAMQSELTEISEAVESWPGVTDIPDETIPALAEVTETTAISETSMASLGEFKVYAYFKGPNGQLTATGTTCKEGRTVAADFNVLPAGTRIYIEGVGERIVEDCGVSGQTLDLYMASKADCVEWGKRNREVWVIE